MSKPSSYELLKEIHAVTSGLDQRLSKRMDDFDDRVNDVESKTDNLVGKIGIGVIVVSAFITTLIAIVSGWAKKVFNV